MPASARLDLARSFAVGAAVVVCLVCGGLDFRARAMKDVDVSGYVEILQRFRIR
jgi:hypothetical protein